MEKPTGHCLCGANDWWQREDGGWNCGVCHPNPNKEEKAPPISKPEEEKPTPEILALCDRVIKGNEVLNIAWNQLKAIDHESQQWRDDLERWHLANEKLRLLCSELKLKGYTDCLYLVDGKKTKLCLPPGDDIGCRVCPSARAWWTEELMNLPGPKVKASERGQETMEFVKKLGEEI